MCHYTLQDTLALREKLKNINQLQQDIDAQKPLQSALWP